MFFAYILYSPTLDKYYIGSTANIDELIKKHNTNHKGFTGRVGDWGLKWKEGNASRSGANSRERQIKGWKSRKMLDKLISGG